MKQIIISTLIVLLAVSCQMRKTENAPAENAAKSSAPEGKELAAWTLEELWRTDTLMRTCESVRFDAERDQLIVSCINGAPWEKDGKGFLALLHADGSVKTERWISGLNAPKGMGILEGMLYVADMDQVVVVDLVKGKVLKKIDVEGAQQLNDVAVGADGLLLVSDSGKGWIWKVEAGRAEAWLKGSFDRPNGLLIEQERVLLATSGGSELLSIDRESMEQELIISGIGHGDGIEYTGKQGHYLVSDWAGRLFLVGPEGMKLTLLNTIEQKDNTADIGFNPSEQVVYVPSFFDNRVVAYRLIENKE